MNVRSRVVIGSTVLTLAGLMSSPPLLLASDQPLATDIVQQICVQCHRLEGHKLSLARLSATDD